MTPPKYVVNTSQFMEILLTIRKLNGENNTP